MSRRRGRSASGCNDHAVIGKLHTVVVDCPDPAALARFYAELLGLVPEQTRWGPLPPGYADVWEAIAGSEWVALVDDEDTIRLALQRAPDLVPPAWPDPARPQQWHLDVIVEDIEAAERAVLALGATRVGDGELPVEGRLGFRVYTDPVGHPFCLEYRATG